MANMFRRGMRGVLIGLEQEPVVVFSVVLSAIALGIALVVPPMRRSMNMRIVNYDTGSFQKAEVTETAAKKD